jgi:hypothetical protein
MCGAIGTPSTTVEPYIIDICGYFPSITNQNIRLLMQTIGTYYTNHRTSITLTRKFYSRTRSGLLLNFEFF